MKFHHKLNYFENIRAWKNHKWRAHTPQIGYDELSLEDQNCLMALNEQLKKLEEKFFPMLKAKQMELQARADDPADWMQYFNLELVIRFYLREDDPEYEEDDENILTEIREPVFEYDRPGRAYGFGITGRSYSHRKEHHCYLYHDLYDHSYLSCADLLRIDDIWVDIKIHEQTDSQPVRPVSISEGNGGADHEK